MFFEFLCYNTTKYRSNILNRTVLMSKITTLFSYLVTNVKLSNKMNLTDDSVNCENIFRDILNICYNYNLENTNLFKSNYGAIDLKDDKSKVIVQVTAQRNKQKIQDTLNDDVLLNFTNFKMIFILISEDSAKHFQLQAYVNPYLNKFDPNDILAVEDLLRLIQTLSDEKLSKIEEILRKNIVIPLPSLKMLDSNLTTIINLLSEEDLEVENDKDNLNIFEIEKKIDFNNLVEIHDEILEFSGYYSKLNSKYKILNLSGKNKERSVLNKLHHFYIDCVKTKQNYSECEIYEAIIEKVLIFIKETPNLENTISEEELLLAVEIVVCDAFIKCKIFKNPEGYNYVNKY